MLDVISAATINPDALYLPPAILCTLCWMKKYTMGTIVPKKAPARYFLYFIALALGGLDARQPNIHGIVATMYEIMKMSCQPWSSVDVTYVHPPQVHVRKRPQNATNLGIFSPGLAVRRYHSPTRANLGPAGGQRPATTGSDGWVLPDVMAIKNIKNDLSGYRSPMVDDTEGNHSSGYPYHSFWTIFW